MIPRALPSSSTRCARLNRSAAGMAQLLGPLMTPRTEGLYQDLHVRNLGQHLRQRYRLTVSDSDIELHARSFHIGSEPPIVALDLPGTALSAVRSAAPLKKLDARSWSRSSSDLRATR